MKTDPAARAPFLNLPHTPATHFRLYFYAAVLQVLAQMLDRFDTAKELYERFGFLAEYNNELAEFGLQGMTLEQATGWWRDGLADWERSSEAVLPLCSLREAVGLDADGLALWMTAGLIEEDPRFGAVFELLHGLTGQPRPTLGLLQGMWLEADETAPARQALNHLQDLGLLEVVNPDAPRLEWALQIPGPVWDALRGPGYLLGQEAQQAPRQIAGGIAYSSPELLAGLEALILPDEVREKVARLPDLLRSGEVGAIIVRGPRLNGRHTLLGGLARALGMGRLDISAAAQNGSSAAFGAESSHPGERWLGSLATLLQAMPVIALDLLPGERAELPNLPGYRGPVGIVLGPSGAVSGELVEQAISITLDLPLPEEREQHWAASEVRLAGSPADFAGRFRLTGGNIRRAAKMAHAIAALEMQDAATLADVQQASRALNRQALETLAQHLEGLVSDQPAWSLLAVDRFTQAELATLESRCRFREQLPRAVGEAYRRQLNVGVRALFTGPSGTGKTLAARLLAGALQKDLYRLDLSAVVNKYIGETEKNLNQAFARAEELDVVLLIDEGDALLTQRTSVSTSNDRYANLETNYLLQRIESYQGILIITTNAADRIDTAFQRRMDIVVEFHAPDAAERFAIWQLHLPLTHHIDLYYLQETAVRCAMMGGQIRNAVLHASLLALQDGGIITGEHLYTAVEREYRKVGASCPLPKPGWEG